MKDIGDQRKINSGLRREAFDSSTRQAVTDQRCAGRARLHDSCYFLGSDRNTESCLKHEFVFIDKNHDFRVRLKESMVMHSCVESEVTSQTNLRRYQELLIGVEYSSRINLFVFSTCSIFKLREIW